MTLVSSSTVAPPWFTAALGQAPEHGIVHVDGADVHLRCWGKAGSPGLILVHGGGANSGWWDHIAPMLAANRRVVAIDLSGHGDSTHRADYHLEQWADEVHAAAAAGGIRGHPYAVGHSLGGFITVVAATRHPASLSGLAIIDSPLTGEPPGHPVRTRSGPPKRYATPEDICARFTTIPPQDVLLPYVAAHVARESIRSTPTGWRWKFDPKVFTRARHDFEFPLVRGLASQIHLPTTYFWCEYGLVTEMMATDAGRLFARQPAIVGLPDAGHHPMLD